MDSAPNEAWRQDPAWRKDPAWRDEPAWRKEPGWRQDPAWRKDPAWRDEPAWRKEPGWRQDPAKRQPGGKETGAVRKRFFGNTEIAQRFMGPARLLLGQLQDDMAYNGLAQGLRRAVIPINQRVEIGPELSKEGDVDIARRFLQVLGTVAIVAYSSHGQSEVLIDARAINTTEVVVEPKVPKESLYLPHLEVRMRQYSTASRGYGINVLSPHPHQEAMGYPYGWSYDCVSFTPFPSTPVNSIFLLQEPDFDCNFSSYHYTATGMFTPDDIDEDWFALYPESMKEAIISVDSERMAPDEFDYEFAQLVVLDPAAQDLPVTPAVLPGWYVVRVLLFSNFISDLPATGDQVEIRLGKPNTMTYSFPTTHTGNVNNGDPYWSGAVLVDVQNGVIAVFDEFEPHAPFGSGGEPDLANAEQVIFHPDSSLNPANLNP